MTPTRSPSSAVKSTRTPSPTTTPRTTISDYRSDVIVINLLLLPGVISWVFFFIYADFQFFYSSSSSNPLVYIVIRSWQLLSAWNYQMIVLSIPIPFSVEYATLLVIKTINIYLPWYSKCWWVCNASFR